MNEIPSTARSLVLVAIACLAIAVHDVSPSSPRQIPDMFMTSDSCLACHNGLVTPQGQDVSIGSAWRSSMMANSSRDPYWQASVRREVMDHPSAKQEIEDECSACHMPMARHREHVMGGKGKVFEHLPNLPVTNRMDRLAADGVSCSMCHQISSERLGTEKSFTAGFVVDTKTPPGKRPAFGPFEIDQGRRRVMSSASLLEPRQSKHIQESALCGSCHTLYTHTLDSDGKIIGKFPEQMPFLEWRHSSYVDNQNCQSCHMPQLNRKMGISSVLSKPREGFSKHVFRGGNFFMPGIFNLYRNELGVTALPGDFAEASRQTAENLQTSAGRIGITAVESEPDGLLISIMAANMTGHKLPTAYPSRRAWIHLVVADGSGQVIFESGGLRPDGSIAGNDNDIDPGRYEPHYELIDDPGQVQIYETIMVDPENSVTTGLISAIRYAKDNRILPNGFDKETAHEDIAVQGRATRDPDFAAMSDAISYRVQANHLDGPFTVRAELWYQPIAFRWAKNLLRYQSRETLQFVSFYESMSENSAIILDSDSKTIAAD